jgi:SAM-dependent methyltransferase
MSDAKDTCDADALGGVLLAEMEKTIAQKVAVCAAHMLLKDGAAILDAGCADGQATAYFALTNPKAHVVGVDYDEGYIGQARERFGHIGNLEFLQQDLRSLDLGGRRLDAIVNLSILHEPFSFTGYRTRTVEEILAAELQNLKVGGVIINRDFVLPDHPDQMVYMALSDDGTSGDAPEDLSYSDLLKLYSAEAMSFDDGDPQGHIKGFFLEEHTGRFSAKTNLIPRDWRVFYLPHQFAWEFIWRKEYRRRFDQEANEKYAFWTESQHRQVPERLGARVKYTAHFENPWILENWYDPHALLFDGNLERLPLPPSNFISVLEKIEPGSSVSLGEHKVTDTAPEYLEVETFRHTTKEDAVYDLVKRPGGDVTDVLPYSLEDDELIVYAKSDYPRPIANTHPRMMTSNLNHKVWSGHVIEPLTAAGTDMAWQETVRQILTERAGLASAVDRDAITTSDLTYYTAPAELNERVRSVFVEVNTPREHQKTLASRFSGFSNDGEIRSFAAQDILDAAQVGLLAEARLEMNTYALMRATGAVPKPWIGGSIQIAHTSGLEATTFEEMLFAARSTEVFARTDTPSGWLDVVRSEFHEIAVDEGRRRAVARQELEFVVPNQKQTDDISTTSVTLACLTRDPASGEVFIGLQDISPTRSQFPAVQERDGHSGHITLPGYRLPSSVRHVQELPAWISRKTGVAKESVGKLGGGYFPSLGVMPNRVFPYVTTDVSDFLNETCRFLPLRDGFRNFERFQDLHTMVALSRAVHALGCWEDYTQNQA